MNAGVMNDPLGKIGKSQLKEYQWAASGTDVGVASLSCKTAGKWTMIDSCPVFEMSLDLYSGIRLNITFLARSVVGNSSRN